MRTFKEVPIPAQMSHLEIDKRGYPVPWIVLRDKNNVPYFAVNNDLLTIECFDHNLCSICGKKLDKDMWLVGGPMSAFHPRGGFLDPPMHYDCGSYALKVCPYLAYTAYKAKPDKLKLDPKDFDIDVLINQTQTDERVPFFVFLLITGYDVKWYPDMTRFVMPNKPYVKFEYWNAGEKITEHEAHSLMYKPTTIK